MRGKKAKRRELKPDSKYNSSLVTKLINYIMLDGKKAVATTLVYAAMEDLAKRSEMEALEALEAALNNIKPTIEVRSKRVGGSNYQVPVPVPHDRQETLALRWLLESVRKSRGSRDTWQVLSSSLLEAINNEGPAINKKKDVERMAEANKAFAHFAW